MNRIRYAIGFDNKIYFDSLASIKMWHNTFADFKVVVENPIEVAYNANVKKQRIKDSVISIQTFLLQK